VQNRTGNVWGLTHIAGPRYRNKTKRSSST
jgi:hypothetical protein